MGEEEGLVRGRGGKMCEWEVRVGELVQIFCDIY
jgi:hypothetical protein